MTFGGAVIAISCATFYRWFERAFVKGGTYANQWETVTIPLSVLPEGIDFTRIKHLLFRLDKAGEVYIDNIRLVELKP